MSEFKLILPSFTEVLTFNNKFTKVDNLLSGSELICKDGNYIELLEIEPLTIKNIPFVKCQLARIQTNKHTYYFPLNYMLSYLTYLFSYFEVVIFAGIRALNKSFEYYTKRKKKIKLLLPSDLHQTFDLKYDESEDEEVIDIDFFDFNLSKINIFDNKYYVLKFPTKVSLITKTFLITEL